MRRVCGGLPCGFRFILAALRENPNEESRIIPFIPSRLHSCRFSAPHRFSLHGTFVPHYNFFFLDGVCHRDSVARKGLRV